MYILIYIYIYIYIYISMYIYIKYPDMSVSTLLAIHKVLNIILKGHFLTFYIF